MSTLNVEGIKNTAATSDAISFATDGTCTARLTNPRSHRNLVINGAMAVAQRGTSSTTSGYGDVDRWQHEYAATDEAPTFAQVDVTSGDAPYLVGLTRAVKITNGNQTSGLQAGSQINFMQPIEAQNIRNSGWNYKSSSSYITFSYWVRASVAQEYHGFVKTADGSNYVYPFSLGSLSANTWTKITKTIPGNSNLQIDNDNGAGFQVWPVAFYGTNYTDNSVTNNAWAAWSSGGRSKDQTSTWWTTNDATFEITGVQLEVGDTATDFEHRIYDDELGRCQRYYQRWEFDADKIGVAVLHVSSNDTSYSTWKYYKPLRSSGSDTSFSYSGASDFDMILDGNWDRAITGITMSASRRGKYQSEFVVTWSTAGSSDECASLRSNGSSGWLAFSAEL